MTQVYLDLKKVVENAHDLRDELRVYNHAKTIVKNERMYKIGEVEEAKKTVIAFEEKYPNLLQVASQAMLETVEDAGTTDHW